MPLYATPSLAEGRNVVAIGGGETSRIPAASPLPAAAGVVHIVGAGPGDPELLTVKALRLLQSADVVVHDRLVSDAVLAHARPDARRIYVGKARGDHSVPQREIEGVLIAEARAGRTVVRLKGGDPFIFGRGGEELAALQAAGIEAHVVPGVTAALGCAAAAGLPLTHRDHAHALTLVTGRPKSDGPGVNWCDLAGEGRTLAVYMGVDAAHEITRELLASGVRADMPVAVVEHGTLPTQRVFKGRLGQLDELVEAGLVAGPAMLFIGETAALAVADHAPLAADAVAA